MGTWEIGYFDNDAAADFSHTLDDAAEAERAGLLRDALRRASETTGYLDGGVAAVVEAAAALVASQCAGGEPVTTAYGPDRPLPPLPPELRELAVTALDRADTGPSELLDLWTGEGAGDLWLGGTERLRKVIAADLAADG
ncbi:DUF4259 domain-containing protein [Streptomyces sparsus]